MILDPYRCRLPKMSHPDSLVTYNARDSTAMYQIGSYLEGLALDIGHQSLLSNRLLRTLLGNKHVVIVGIDKLLVTADSAVAQI